VEPSFSCRGRQGSTRRGRFSDEPFGVRDIQFHSPQILVEPCPTGEEISNFRGTRRFGGTGGPPVVTPVEVEDALQAGDMPAPAGDEQQQGAALLVAAPHYCCETAVAGHSAKNAGDLDMCLQAVAAQVASRSSAPISTAASASRLRAPRKRSSVAPSRVTRLMAARAFRCSAPAFGGERSRKTRSTGRPSIAL